MQAIAGKARSYQFTVSFARVAQVHHPEIAKALRQVPPSHASAVPVQYRFHKQAVVTRRHLNIDLPARAIGPGCGPIDPL